MLKKNEMQTILNHALNNKPYSFYGDYVHGFTGYWKAKDGCDLELCITHTGQGATLNALLFERVTGADGKWDVIHHKQNFSRPNKHALKALREWLPVEYRGAYYQ